MLASIPAVAHNSQGKARVTREELVQLPGCDWRNENCYAYLQGAGRQGFAWEWLRRTRGYRANWHRYGPGMETDLDGIRVVRVPHRSRDNPWGLVFRGGPTSFRSRSAHLLEARV